jgi:uncharacterized protein (TIGR00266 family)
MKIDIELGPGSAVAKVSLEKSEEITTEAGSMIAVSDDMEIETTTHKKNSGSFKKAFKRLLSGENFFINHYTAGSNGGTLYLSTTLPGDMLVHELKGESLIVQGGSYVASEPGIEIDFGWQGFKSMFSGESIFWINLNGQGKVIINSYGAIYPVEVDGEYIVDTGHIVAFNETLDFSVTKAGGSWMSSFLAGEGLVCKFKGKGTVWCQSHNAGSLGLSLSSMLKPIKK